MCFSPWSTHFGLYEVVFGGAEYIWRGQAWISIEIIDPILIVGLIMKGEISFHSFVGIGSAINKIFKLGVIKINLFWLNNFFGFAFSSSHINKYVKLDNTLVKFRYYAAGYLKNNMNVNNK